MQWQNSSPKANELMYIKKHIKSLRSQLRWKLVEVGCLEEVATSTSLIVCLDLFKTHASFILHCVMFS